MEMVPLSIALQAVEEAQNNSKSINQGPNDLNIDNYIDQLESAMKELQTSVKNLDVND